MGLMNKLHGENRTFSELSDHVFSQMIHAGHGSDRIDVVFDVYHSDTIKSAERIQRGSTEGLALSNILPGHKIKNWRRLLSCTESKNKLTAFLAESRKEHKFREKLGRKGMFVTSSDRCIKLTESGWQSIDYLQSTQKEADTRILLHAKHAAETIPALICITKDTYVFIICLGLCQDVYSNIFIRRGYKSYVGSLVDITKLAAALGRDVCTALLGLNPWTGCDTISAFAGQRKLKALKILLREQKFIDAFVTLGSSWNVANELFCIIEEFVCQLYCRNTTILKVNEPRYQMFRSRRGEMESAQLPPCEDTLKQHTANYQAAIWRRGLVNSPETPNHSQGHGWTTSEDGSLVINWMTGSPAPQVVLSLLSCKCARACRPNDCTCIVNGMKWTAACKLQTCSNMAGVDDEPENDQQDSSDSEDE